MRYQTLSPRRAWCRFLQQQLAAGGHILYDILVGCFQDSIARPLPDNASRPPALCVTAAHSSSVTLTAPPPRSHQLSVANRAANSWGIAFLKRCGGFSREISALADGNRCEKHAPEKPKRKQNLNGNIKNGENIMKKHWLSLAIAGFGLELTHSLLLRRSLCDGGCVRPGSSKKSELPALYRAGIPAVPQ